jgi:putative CocE/NonD family hydrolase
MDDGVNLAADVYLPENYSNEKVPVLIVFERYWRSSESRKTKGETPTLYGREKLFNENGYAIVIVDTRGSGASFGTRLSEYSPQEVMDAKVVVDWVIDQSWSNGNVGSYGTSYTGTTAELLCATKHPAVKAVIPGWSDFDLYRSPARPYGLIASKFIKKWGLYVRLLDRNRSLFIGSKIRPVVKDSLKPALKDHKDNMKVFKGVKDGEYREGDSGYFDYERCSVVSWKKEIEESNVPMLVLTSWMDAGTAEGTIQRLEHFSNPQKVLLMSTSHGGWSNASPFSVGDSLIYPVPRMNIQNQMQLDFFDHYLKGVNKGVEEWPLVQYFNMGGRANQIIGCMANSWNSRNKLLLQPRWRIKSNCTC